MGLSVEALISIVRISRTKRNVSRAAPCTWGMQRSAYASCTRPQSACARSIGLSAKILRRLAADWSWPRCGRASWIRLSNARCDPFSASRVMAPMMSAAIASRSARRRASAPIAVMTCVPLMSAMPSFGASVTG